MAGGANAESESTGRRYSGKSEEERTKERRQAFLEAGMELFGTRGFPDVTVAHIVELAGFNRRAFYETFSDREALLVAVHDLVIADLLPLATSVKSGDLSEAGTVDTVERLVRYYTDDVRRIRIQFQTVVGVSDALETHRRVTTRALADLVGELLGEAAGGTPVERRCAALGFVGAIDTLFVDWLWKPDYTLDELRDELIALARQRFFRPA